LEQDPSGAFYAITQQGGADGAGVFYRFTDGIKPFVIPTVSAAAPGTAIGIEGHQIAKATAVSFNGTAATFKVVSDSFLQATVPAGSTTGMISVTLPSGTLQSGTPFSVLP
jgi:hypothetical protein